MKYIIGVDNGGTYIKAGVFDESGERLALAKVPSVTRSLPGGRVEIDLAELWNANVACVRAAISDAGISADDVASIGFAGQGKGLYAIDETGAPVRSAITSSDNRAAAVAEEWAQDGTVGRVSEITGQGLFAVHPVTLLAWLKRTSPDDYARVRWVFSMKDYLVYRATGRAVSDPSNQSGNSFMDIRTRDYDPRILEELGIPEVIDALPPLHHATEVVGPLTEEAAAELGCSTSTLVITGLFDINASALAAGLVDDSAICLITGTVGVNVYASREPVLDRSVAMNSIYAVPGLYLVEEGSSSSIGGLEWVIDTLFTDERQRARAADDPSSVYGRVEAMAAGLTPDRSDAIFLPYFAGDEGLTVARGSWVRVAQGDDRVTLLRAAYEGFAFAHRRHVDRLLESSDHARTLHVVGGGVNSPLFLQILADVLQRPLVVLSGDELGVKGVAMAAGVASGVYDGFPAAIEKLTPEVRTITPDPGAADVYDRKYAVFARAVDLLTGL